MLRLLLILLLLLASWLGLFPNVGNSPERSPNSVEALREAFINPDCPNPCWLGIEVGVTDRTTTKRILHENGITYTLEGYTGNSIWIHDIPNGLFPTIAPGKFTRGGINIGEDGTVALMTFDVDLCVSTVINAYGPPHNWPIGDETSLLVLVYPDKQLFLNLNHNSQRVDGIFLHTRGAMPPDDQLEDWSLYADMFSDDCSDVFNTQTNR